jgi:hypothetical protein
VSGLPTHTGAWPTGAPNVGADGELQEGYEPEAEVAEEPD